MSKLLILNQQQSPTVFVFDPIVSDDNRINKKLQKHSIA